MDSEARLVFDLVSHLRGVTVFFDEIDDLLRKRLSGEEPTFIKLIVPAMLNRLQDLRDAAPRQEICILVGTNFVDKIEPALTRPGRIDELIPVPYPDPPARCALLQERLIDQLSCGQMNQADIDYVVEKTAGWPWSTLSRLAKDLKRAGAPGHDQIAAAIESRRSEFQAADLYYAEASRWEQFSGPLARELSAHSLAFSSEQRTCRAKLDALMLQMGTELQEHVRKQVVATFEIEWNRRHQG